MLTICERYSHYGVPLWKLFKFPFVNKSPLPLYYLQISDDLLIFIEIGSIWGVATRQYIYLIYLSIYLLLLLFIVICR